MKRCSRGTALMEFALACRVARRSGRDRRRPQPCAWRRGGVAAEPPRPQRADRLCRHCRGAVAVSRPSRRFARCPQAWSASVYPSGAPATRGPCPEAPGSVRRISALHWRWTSVDGHRRWSRSFRRAVFPSAPTSFSAKRGSCDEAAEWAGAARTCPMCTGGHAAVAGGRLGGAASRRGGRAGRGDPGCIRGCVTST